MPWGQGWASGSQIGGIVSSAQVGFMDIGLRNTHQHRQTPPSLFLFLILSKFEQEGFKSS